MVTSECVIEEIRESRRRMSEQCRHDPPKHIEFLKTFNDKYCVQVEKFRRKFSGSFAEDTRKESYGTD